MVVLCFFVVFWTGLWVVCAVEARTHVCCMTGGGGKSYVLCSRWSSANMADKHEIKVILLLSHTRLHRMSSS